MINSSQDDGVTKAFISLFSFLRVTVHKHEQVCPCFEMKKCNYSESGCVKRKKCRDHLL